MKKLLFIASALTVLLLASCEPNVDVETSDTSTTDNNTQTTTDPDTTQTFTEGLNIVWNGSTATVSGNVEGVTVTNDNGYVTVTSTVKAVYYELSGNGSGQFKLYSDYKYELRLNDLTLTCPNAPAINSQCKKTGKVSVSGSLYGVQIYIIY